MTDTAALMFYVRAAVFVRFLFCEAFCERLVGFGDDGFEIGIKHLARQRPGGLRTKRTMV